MTIELEVLAGGVSHPDNAYLVRAGQARVLLDAGAAHSSAWIDDLHDPPHAVWLSHVHADHAQGWSDLVRAFGVLPTWASPHTKRGLARAWQVHAPLVADSVQDVIQTLNASDALALPMPQTQGIVLRQYPCGHIPGSSALYMDIPLGEKFHRLCYLSDFSRHAQLSVQPAEPEHWPSPDTLIIECALAHVSHATREAVDRARQALESLVVQSGASLWPVSSFGQAQEVIACAVAQGERPVVWETIDADAWRAHVDVAATMGAARAALTSGRMVVVPGAHMVGGVSHVLGLECLDRDDARIVSTNAHPQGSLAHALWSGGRLPRWRGRRLTVRAELAHIDLWNHAPLEDIVETVLELDPEHVVLVHGQRKGVAQARRALRRAGYTGRMSAPKHKDVVPLAR